MLASDLANRDFVGAQNPDALLYVKFYKATFQNNFKSEKEGRPIYEEELRVMIQPTGNNLLCVHSRCTDAHKQRFPFQWQQYLAAQGPGDDTKGIEGTPVEQWPAIGRSQAEELRGAKFYTVEQIANASDAQIQALGMAGRMLVQKAQAFLANAQGSALVQQQAADLERAKQEKADMKEQMDRMNAQIEQLLAAAKPAPLSVKRG